MRQANEKETILVTGGTSAAGAVCADFLARAGHDVFAMDEALGEGEEAAFVVDVVNRSGAVHALLNFEAQVLAGAVEDTNEEEMQGHFEANYFSVVRAVRVVLPFMRTQRAGLIVNVLASIRGATTGSGFFAQHAAAQGAVRALSEALREEVNPFGIGVALVEGGRLPAGSRLEETQKARTSGTYWERYKQALKGVRGAAPSHQPPEALASQVERVVVRARTRERMETAGEVPLQNQRVVREVTPARAGTAGQASRGRLRSLDAPGERPAAQFQGEWEDDEKRLIEAAISEREIRFQLESRTEHTVETWLCSTRDLPGGHLVYIANRPGIGRVLAASTASGLADDIVRSSASRVV